MFCKNVQNKHRISLVRAVHLALVALVLCYESIALAVIDADPKKIDFTYELGKLRTSLSLPVRDRLENVTATRDTIRIRAKRAKQDSRVEELAIGVPANTKELVQFVKKFSKAQKTSALYDYLTDKVVKTKAPVRLDGTKKIIIDEEAIDLFDSAMLTTLLTKPHHNVEVLGAELAHNQELKSKLVSQLRGHIDDAQLKSVIASLRKNKDLSLDRDLLPPFAKKMVKNFLAFKGPNCFHAALAFHGEALTQSQFVNVKKEDGYHRAMINYDELWRAINSYFYEVNVAASPLKYGDMIVFFELPKQSSEAVNYRWIRHAATYLFGNYTFSKGSKSPDTPYTVKTIDEEWKTWDGFTQNMGVKVFRRSSANIKKIPPVQLVDWVY